MLKPGTHHVGSVWVQICPDTLSRFSTPDGQLARPFCTCIGNTFPYQQVTVVLAVVTQSGKPEEATGIQNIYKEKAYQNLTVHRRICDISEMSDTLHLFLNNHEW